MNPLVVLGVTGSIGEQTLDVARRLDIPVAAMAANRGTPELVAAAESWPDARVVVADPTPDARDRCTAALGDRVAFGMDEVTALAAVPGHTVVNGIVGAAGLPPSMAAAQAGNRIALANKESLVAGGDVLAAAVRATFSM